MHMYMHMYMCMCMYIAIVHSYKAAKQYIPSNHLAKPPSVTDDGYT